MNGTGNGDNTSAKAVPPVRYRLIGPDGSDQGVFYEVRMAAHLAGRLWPGIEQRDHENGRDGWDIEVIR